MYLEHFCLLIPAEWSAVFNTSSHSEALKKILMIFLIKYQAPWLFHWRRYWFPRWYVAVKSCVRKFAAKSLNIFEKFQVLVKLQAFSFTENYLLFLVFFQVFQGRSRNPIRSKMELCDGSSPLEVFKYFHKGFHLPTSKVPESTSAI